MENKPSDRTPRSAWWQSCRGAPPDRRATTEPASRIRRALHRLPAYRSAPRRARRFPLTAPSRSDPNETASIQQTRLIAGAWRDKR